MAMNAKFSGTCKKCGKHIQVGERIEWSKETGAMHYYCAANSAKPQAKIVSKPAYHYRAHTYGTWVCPTCDEENTGASCWECGCPRH